MTQANPIIGADRSGLQYRTEDNDGKRALLNHHKGANAPSYAEAGTLWLDDSITPWLMKLYDGTDWIILGEFNATTNNFAPYVAGSVVGAASTTAEGIIELATQAEVDAGTDTTRAVTPATLAGASIGGKVLGQAYAFMNTVFTTTNTIPIDDTIPQQTEGGEVMTVSYTPQSSTSKLYISFGLNCHNSVNASIVCALFRDSTANAIHSIAEYNGNSVFNISNDFVVDSNTTITTTFKLRIGSTSSGTVTINGIGGTRYLGGSMNAYLTVTEIEV